MNIVLTFEEFLGHIYGLAARMAPGHPIQDGYNEEKGLYTARVCGYRYSARPTSRQVTIKAGTHCYTYAI